MHNSCSQRSLHKGFPGAPEKSKVERSSEAALRRKQGQWAWNCADLGSSLSVGPFSKAGGHVLHLQHGPLLRLCNGGPQPFKGEGSSRTPCPQHIDYVSTFSMCFLRKFTLTKATINSVQLFDASVLFVTTASAQIRETFTYTWVRCV